MNEADERKAIFLHSPRIEGFSYPSSCPFKAERAGMTRRILRSMGMLTGRGRCETAPESATRDELERFHAARYLDVMIAAEGGTLDVEGLEMGLGSQECPVFVGMYEYAALACGATLSGARQILAGGADVTFNPSGGFHHAGPALASGFCYLNDVVLACGLLAEKGRRVAFLDVDAHHGDGVQNAFYDRRDVMTVSLHENGKTLIPGTGFENEIGVGEGRGYSVNVPLPEATYDEAYVRAFESLAVPVLGSYNPDVIVLELGMDGLAGDPLTHLQLTNNAYADVVQRILGFRKPVLATGGGGYNVDNTVRGWALAWAILCGEADGANVGLGGVMMETTDWHGGLCDRALVPSDQQRRDVEPAIDATIEAVKANVFALHGL